MGKLKQKLGKNSGFTLVEMLIVVAIIAILIAVSIPLVSTALESTRDRTDQANMRAAKAEATMAFMGVTKIYKLDNNGNATANAIPTAATAADPVAYRPGHANGDTPIYYDAKTGKLVTGTSEQVQKMTAYGKCAAKHGSAEDVAKDFLSASGKTAAVTGDNLYGPHKGMVIQITITDVGTITLSWTNSTGVTTPADKNANDALTAFQNGLKKTTGNQELKLWQYLESIKDNDPMATDDVSRYDELYAKIIAGEKPTFVGTEVARGIEEYRILTEDTSSPIIKVYEDGKWATDNQLQKRVYPGVRYLSVAQIEAFNGYMTDYISAKKAGEDTNAVVTAMNDWWKTTAAQLKTAYPEQLGSNAELHEVAAGGMPTWWNSVTNVLDGIAAAEKADEDEKKFSEWQQTNPKWAEFAGVVGITEEIKTRIANNESVDATYLDTKISAKAGETGPQWVLVHHDTALAKLYNYLAGGTNRAGAQYTDGAAGALWTYLSTKVSQIATFNTLNQANYADFYDKLMNNLTGTAYNDVKTAFTGTGSNQNEIKNLFEQHYWNKAQEVQ